MNSSYIATTQPNTSSILADSQVFNISLLQTTNSGSTATTSYVDNKFNSILTSNNQFTGQTDITQLIENISTGNVASNALSIDYLTNSAILYISPSSASNISLILTNIPTNYTNGTINLTFIINTGTYKQYINTISINGSSYTMKASGGLANVSVNSSALIVIQNINIIFLSGSISQVLTSINSWF